MLNDVFKEAEDRMKKTVAAVRHDFASIRTGRASANLFDKINVDYYGTKTPLNQLAGISVPEPQLVVIQPWDKSSAPEIEKAIRQSDLGLNPTTDGEVIRVPFPPLSEERRKELVKVIKKMAEEGRIGIRNARHEARDALKTMEKQKEISEDDRIRGEENIQELTDKYIEEIDKLLSYKENEVMEV